MLSGSSTESYLPRHLQGVTVGEVRVCRRDGQNDGVGVFDVLHAHAADVILDVGRLISRCHLHQHETNMATFPEKRPSDVAF